MELFVIRHAIAVPGSVLADADRPLSPKGRARFSQAVLGLQCLKVRFDRLYHSPWLRAVETAELLAPVLDGKAVDSAALARAPSQDLLDALVGERVALVGHEPWMGELVAWLTTGAPPHGSVFAFKRGSSLVGGAAATGSYGVTGFSPAEGAAGAGREGTR